MLMVKTSTCGYVIFYYDEGYYKTCVMRIKLDIYVFNTMVFSYCRLPVATPCHSSDRTLQVNYTFFLITVVEILCW